jgi:uncharacterized protein
MEYTINNYRVRKLDDNYFVSTDSGSFAILSEKELKDLKSQNFDEKLSDKLSEREIILNDMNFLEFTKDLSKRYSFLKQGTSLHIIIPSLRCNMKCIYCHASYKDKDAKQYDMDSETARKTVEFMFQSPSNHISLEIQGGEPLLNWERVKEIIIYARELNQRYRKNLRVSIVTNLTLMDDEKFNFLVNHDVGVCTSFDGTKDIQEKNRPYNNGYGYEIIKKWIKKFIEAEKTTSYSYKPNALITTTKYCFGKEKEIVDEYINLGLHRMHVRFVNFLGIAKKTWENIGYTPEEFITFWTNIVEYIEEKKNEGIDFHERIIEIISYKLSEKIDPNYLDLRSPCGAAIGQIAYNYNGDIFTCDEARMINEDLFKIGNVHNDTYKKVTTCEKTCAVIDASINDQYICNSCAYKPFCGVCPVCNYSEQGSIIAKIPETSRCKIYMAQFDWIIKKKFIS